MPVCGRFVGVLFLPLTGYPDQEEALLVRSIYVLAFSDSSCFVEFVAALLFSEFLCA